MIDHLKDESIESRFDETVDQLTDQTDSIEKTFFLHIDIKNIYLLIFEMISNKN
jgi:hypothetical protein